MPPSSSSAAASILVPPRSMPIRNIAMPGLGPSGWGVRAGFGNTGHAPRFTGKSYQLLNPSPYKGERRSEGRPRAVFRTARRLRLSPAAGTIEGRDHGAPVRQAGPQWRADGPEAGADRRRQRTQHEAVQRPPRGTRLLYIADQGRGRSAAHGARPPA